MVVLAAAAVAAVVVALVVFLLGLVLLLEVVAQAIVLRLLSLDSASHICAPLTPSSELLNAEPLDP